MLRRLLLRRRASPCWRSSAAAASGTRRRAGLVGEVGPGFSIEVKQDGKDVKTLKAGTYTIKVEDKASIHDFHLIGPGVNKATSVPFVGDTDLEGHAEDGQVHVPVRPACRRGHEGHVQGHRARTASSGRDLAVLDRPGGEVVLVARE